MQKRLHPLPHRQVTIEEMNANHRRWLAASALYKAEKAHVEYMVILIVCSALAGAIIMAGVGLLVYLLKGTATG